MTSRRDTIHALAALGWLVVSGTVGAAALSPITDTAGLQRAEREGVAGQPFDVTATALTPLRDEAISFNVRDEAGPTALGTYVPLPPFAPGDTVRVEGTMTPFDDGRLRPIVATLTVLNHGPAPEPFDVSPEELYGGGHVFDLVRVTGIVADAFRDETNPDFVFIVLNCGGGAVYVSSSFLADDALDGLVDATVSIVGTIFPHNAQSPRARLGYEIALIDPANLTVLHPAPADPFDVPLLDGTVHDVWQPKPGLPLRRRLCGRVLARQPGGKILLRLPTGETSAVELSAGDPPEVGATIETVGLPETDFYHLNLSRAVWREAPLGAAAAIPPETAPPAEIPAAGLLTDDAGRRSFNLRYNGALVRLVGKILSVPRADGESGPMQLDCDGVLVAVDAGAVPDAFAGLTAGCTVAATGICVMETENWRPQAPFPHIRGLAIVPRSAKDVEVLARPSWWTPARLLTTIGTLLAALVAILLWNAALRRLVARKSREAIREQIGHVKAKLKTDERTRLAVELHDSISQNLTGVALEIKAAQRAVQNRQPSALEHLDIAERSLGSCHAELRNCLWDLRHGMLECTDLNEAIRRTLQSQIGNVGLSVRFGVPRDRLNDETVYAVLKIVRELAVNAVHHGGATEVDVEGTLADGEIRMTVADNGCGFDPESVPGPEQGHFGLLGVQERIDAFGGRMEIRSEPGTGTRIRIALKPKIDAP